MRVPDDLRRTISSWAGPAGQAWLAELPGLVGELAERWSLAIGEPYPSGFTALAVRATRADGLPCVLKVTVRDDEDPAPEGAALRHFGGRAAVALLAEDEARRALLLERCDPGTPLLDRPDDDEASYAICGLLRDLWSPPPAAHPFGSLRETAERWVPAIRWSTAFDAALRASVCDLLDDLVSDDVPPVVLHGDLHAANVLRATRRPWLAIDPKGRAGDPAYDAAPLLRDRVTPATAPRRLAIATEVLGLDPAKMRGWALAKAVEGAVWSYDRHDVAGGDAFAEAALILAALPG